MRKHKHKIIIFMYSIATIMAVMIISIVVYFLTSCQPTDPLKGLNCPCKVITAETTPRGSVVTYIDKDGKQRTVISEALYEQYKKNNEPLNK